MNWIADVIAVAGLACVGYGVWQMHEPSAYIVVGGALVLYGVLAAKARSRIDIDNGGQK